jgi:hypothetical protein
MAEMKNPPDLSMAGVRNGQRLGGCAAVIVALLTASCTHGAPATDPRPSKAVLPSTLPGNWLFCVEDPEMNGALDAPLIRRGLVCPWTVDDVRRMVSRLRSAE